MEDGDDVGVALEADSSKGFFAACFLPTNDEWLSYEADMWEEGKETHKAANIFLVFTLIPGKFIDLVFPTFSTISLSSTPNANAIFLTTVLTLVIYAGMSSRIGSSALSAMGQTLSMPWRGSRIRPEMKDEAAEEGAPVRMQTVGRRTVRALR